MTDAGGSPGQPPPPASKIDDPLLRPAAAPAKPDDRKFFRGDIHVAYDVPTHGDSSNDIESKKRPVLIIQRDDVTEKRHTLTILPLTTNLARHGRTSIMLDKKVYDKLDQNSLVLCDQFFSINKEKIGGRICRLTDAMMTVVTTKYRYVVNL
jgi:mRNA-degrading endonuclease toxin of MazEF toxin-antitoxin module